MFTCLSRINVFTFDMYYAWNAQFPRGLHPLEIISLLSNLLTFHLWGVHRRSQNHQTVTKPHIYGKYVKYDRCWMPTSAVTHAKRVLLLANINFPKQWHLVLKIFGEVGITLILKMSRCSYWKIHLSVYFKRPADSDFEIQETQQGTIKI